MNPNETIKKWLVATGKQFGINQAHAYRWPDAETRPYEFYATFQPISGASFGNGYLDLTTADSSNTVTRRAAQPHIQQYRVDLYRSEDGLYELEALAVAIKSSDIIRGIFKDGGCAFGEVLDITDETEFDDERIDYHFRMVFTVRVNVEISLDEINGEVERVDITLETGNPTHEIDRDGITVT